MNIDELTQSFRNISNEKKLQDLVHWIVAWKLGDEDIRELEAMVEKCFGNMWLQSQADHSNAYKLWSEFKRDAIGGIGGMTMNERLFFFGLFERFDQSDTEEQKHAVYSKLLAKP